VQLEVEFPLPFLEVLRRLFEVTKKLMTRGELDLGDPFEILKALQPFKVL
jgi:hypothetical protein